MTTTYSLSLPGVVVALALGAWVLWPSVKARLARPVALPAATLADLHPGDKFRDHKHGAVLTVARAVTSKFDPGMVTVRFYEHVEDWTGPVAARQRLAGSITGAGTLPVLDHDTSGRWVDA